MVFKEKGIGITIQNVSLKLEDGEELLFQLAEKTEIHVQPGSQEKKEEDETIFENEENYRLNRTSANNRADALLQRFRERKEYYQQCFT